MFLVEEGGAAQVLARYPNGRIAAVVAPFGAGAVAVVGPHPEATPDWFADSALPVQGRPTSGTTSSRRRCWHDRRAIGWWVWM